MSEDWLKPDDPMPDFVPAQKGDGKKKRFGDVFGASAEAMRATDLTSSEAENQGHAFREIDQAILDDFGGDASAKSSALMALDVPSLKGLSTEDRVKLSVGSAYDISMLERYKVYRDGLPPERRDKIPDPARIEARAREIALHRYTEAEKEMANGKGFSGGAAQFLGGTAGAMTDPVNLGSMFVFKRPITTFKGAVAYGAATSGATEIVLQPVVQQYRQEVGLPAGWDEGLQNVVYATIGGGVFGAGEGGLIKLGQALDARKRRGLAGAIDAELEEIVTRHESGDLDAEGVQEEFAALAEREPAFAAAMEISQRARAAEQAMEENPFGLTPQDLVAHEARIKNAEAELVDTPAPHMGEDLPPAPDVAQEVVPPYLADLGLEVVNLTDLARDPKRFQFKASDADGVTDALQDIDEWVPERAGALLVWEGLDGVRYIANGHQRHALGLRLMESGADPIQSPAFILREADGVTAEQAMVRGALVNIGEGSGTSLDAARILRADPEMITNLPPRSPLVREAQGLTRLSDDAFGLVVNEKVSPRWGALVGKAVEDPDLQGQIALALQAADPRTASEAASIVADLQRAPVVEGTTIDLFGESGFKQALIAERAKVKAAALSQLSRDKRAFATLNRRADRIEAEGNRLDREGNEQVEVDAATLAERLDAQAHVKGDVSDALNKAAQAVADGQSIKQAARGLIDALDGGANGGGAGRGLAAGGGSAPEFAGGRAEGGARGRLGTGLQDLLDADAGAPGTARAIKAHEVAAVAAEEFGPDVAALIARAAEAKIKTGKIETAAVRYRGKIWRAASHEDAMAAIEQATGQRPSGFDGGPLGAEAGFVDDYGKFLTREDAALAAMAAGQITDPSIARVMEMRLKRGEAVPLATEHVALANKGGRFAKAAEMPMDVPRSELARMATRFVNDDASVVQAAIREAVLCAGGEPMAGLGQLAAGSALGLGLGLAAGGAVIAYGTPQQRDDRYEAWFTQLHPDEQSYAPLPKSHQRALKKMRRENREALMWRVQLERQTRDMFRSNLDAMPDYQGQLRVNGWAERFTGVSASFLDDMIIQESAGRWDVQAPTSSATGGMQFINSTWRNMLRKHGESYGLKVDVNSQEALDLRTDPRWGTVMGAEYAAENGRWLGRRLDRRITQKDAYLAHFLGRDGALALLRARPTAVAADIMPRAAAANLNVFYQNGDLDKPRTVSGVIQRQTRKFSSEPLFVDERFEERGA